VADDVRITVPYPRDPVKARSDACYIAARERLLTRILAAETSCCSEDYADNDSVERIA
jgi:hypothetical protein